jgi:hypothetical protein
MSACSSMYQGSPAGAAGLKPALQAPSSASVSFSDQMRKVFVVFVADVFQQLGVRHQTEPIGSTPGPRVRFGVVDDDLKIRMAEVAAAEALAHMQCIAVGVASGVEPGSVVETCRIDDERIAIPMPDGISRG